MVTEIISGSRTPRSLERLLDADERRLGVERVEDRLEQQEVGAAVDQPERLLGVGRAHLVEGRGAERRRC